MIVVSSRRPPRWLGARAGPSHFPSLLLKAATNNHTMLSIEHTLSLLTWLPWPHSLTASVPVGSKPPPRTDPQSSQSHSLPPLSHEGQRQAPLYLLAQGLWWPHCHQATHSRSVPDLCVALNSALGSCVSLSLVGLEEKAPGSCGARLRAVGGPSSSGPQCGLEAPRILPGHQLT